MTIIKSHEELIREAEKNAASMKQAEKIDRAYVHSYVANHELRLVVQAIDHLRDKVNLVWNFVMATAVTVGVGLVSLLVVAAAKWLVK